MAGKWEERITGENENLEDLSLEELRRLNDRVLNALTQKATQLSPHDELEQMSLKELRLSEGLSQTKVDSRMKGGRQGKANTLWKTEGRDFQMRVSSMESYVKAVGARLRVLAEFPDGRKIEIVKQEERNLQK